MANTVQYSKNSVIFFAGAKSDKVYILKSGSVSLVHTEPDTKKEVAVPIEQGNFFGVKNALVNVPHSNTALSVTDSTVIEMSVEEFEKIIVTKKDVIMKMLKAFSEKLEEFHVKVREKMGMEAVDNSEFGIFSIANSFYYTGQYTQCLDVSKRFLELYPNSDKKENIEAFLKESEKKLADQKTPEPEITEEQAGEQVYDAISLPEAFSRFEQKFEPNKVIFIEHDHGDKFYLIQSGLVRIIKNINGKNTNISMSRPGDFVGLKKLFMPGAHSATCVTATDVKALVFNKENFEHFALNAPQIVIMVLKQYARIVYENKRMFINLCIDNMLMRLRDMFVMFYDMGLSQNLGEEGIRFNMTVHDVAQWLDIDNDETEKKIHQLVDLHQIKIDKGGIIVFDIEDLRVITERYSK